MTTIELKNGISTPCRLKNRFYTVHGTGVAQVWGSPDGTTWRLLMTMTVTAASDAQRSDDFWPWIKSVITSGAPIVQVVGE